MMFNNGCIQVSGLQVHAQPSRTFLSSQQIGPNLCNIQPHVVTVGRFVSNRANAPVLPLSLGASSLGGPMSLRPAGMVGYSANVVQPPMSVGGHFPFNQSTNGPVLPPLNPELVKRLRGDSIPTTPPDDNPFPKKQKTLSSSPKNPQDSTQRQSNTEALDPTRHLISTVQKNNVDKFMSHLGINLQQYEKMKCKDEFGRTFNILVNEDFKRLTELKEKHKFTPAQLVDILNANKSHLEIQLILENKVVPFLLGRGFDRDDITRALSKGGQTTLFKKLMGPAPALSTYIFFMGNFNGANISQTKAQDILSWLVSEDFLNGQGHFKNNILEKFTRSSTDLKDRFELTDEQVGHIRLCVNRKYACFDIFKRFLENEHLKCLFFGQSPLKVASISWLFEKSSNGEHLNLDKLLQVIFSLRTGIKEADDARAQLSKRLLDLCCFLTRISNKQFIHCLNTDSSTGEPRLIQKLRDCNFNV